MMENKVPELRIPVTVAGVEFKNPFYVASGPTTKSVRQLVEFSENDLLNIRNFGVKSIEEVKDKLESMGLSLKA